MPGGVLVQNLRSVREVIIPDGTEKIGSCWFWGSGVEGVDIPASVVEIWIAAFRRCTKLKKVAFSEAKRANTETEKDPRADAPASSIS